MTEDIPLEITSSDMANLPISIAVLIVAAVVVRMYISIKRKKQPPVFRALWCAAFLVPLGVVAAWITNQMLVNEDNSLWILSYSALGATTVALLVEPLVSRLIDRADIATATAAATLSSSQRFRFSRSFRSKSPATRPFTTFPPTRSAFPSDCLQRFFSPFIYWDSDTEGPWSSCPSFAAFSALPSISL